MKRQEVIISLKEYRNLLLLQAEYEKLLGQYQLLSYAYQQTQKEKVKKKNPIGFNCQEK